MPNGLTVDYENNGKINAGDYTVIAKFIDTTGNYENPTDKTATLTINKATYDMSKVVFADKTVTYNGNAYTIIFEDYNGNIQAHSCGSSPYCGCFSSRLPVLYGQPACRHAGGDNL